MSNTSHTPMPLGGDKPFERADSTVYQLMHHGWLKGIEQFRNRIWFNVNVDRESGISREEAAAFISVACNAYNGLVVGNTNLRQDLSDARTGWEQATEAVREAEEVLAKERALRDQMVDVVKEMMQLGDRLVDDIYGYEFVQKAKAALAAAEAA